MNEEAQARKKPPKESSADVSRPGNAHANNPNRNFWRNFWAEQMGLEFTYAGILSLLSIPLRTSTILATFIFEPLFFAIAYLRGRRRERETQGEALDENGEKK